MKIYKLGFLALCTLFLCACGDKETENLSQTTYYVAFEILGDNPAIVQVGTPYVDAGAKASENGKAVSSFDTKSNVDYKTMGMYQVEYSATNSAGLKSRAVRDVVVCNPSVTTNISGAWAAAPDGTYRFYGGAETYYGGPNYIVNISRLAPGFFSVSDFLAGWYSIRAGYGAAYNFRGYIALNGDNTLGFISCAPSPWGVGLDYFKDGIYDPATSTINWVVGFGAPLGSAMHFFVKLTK